MTKKMQSLSLFTAFRASHLPPPQPPNLFSFPLLLHLFLPRILQQCNYPKDADPPNIKTIGHSRNRRKKMRKRIQMRMNWPLPLPDNVSYFYFLNPISNLCISFSPIPLGFPSGYYIAISGSSRCAALVVNGRQLFLFRDDNPDLIVLPSYTVYQGSQVLRGQVLLYCLDSSIVVIDPRHHRTLSMEHFEMDVNILLKSDGQLLLVKAFFNFEEEFEIKGFRVFKVDLSNERSEPMECLGDRMLLLARYSSISLVADGIGGKRNCIYYSEGSIGKPFSIHDDAEWSSWKVFDWGSESITDWPLTDTLSKGDCLKIKKNAQSWIMPSFARV